MDYGQKKLLSKTMTVQYEWLLESLDVTFSNMLRANFRIRYLKLDESINSLN